MRSIIFSLVVGAFTYIMFFKKPYKKKSGLVKSGQGPYAISP